MSAAVIVSSLFCSIYLNRGVGREWGNQFDEPGLKGNLKGSLQPAESDSVHFELFSR